MFGGQIFFDFLEFSGVGTFLQTIFGNDEQSRAKIISCGGILQHSVAVKESVIAASPDPQPVPVDTTISFFPPANFLSFFFSSLIYITLTLLPIPPPLILSNVNSSPYY
jgi:hypothetical protein